MRPISNKINIPLLIIAVGLLGYFLIALYSTLVGTAVLVGPIYPIYISIGVACLAVLGFTFLIRARNKWERNAIVTGK